MNICSNHVQATLKMFLSMSVLCLGDAVYLNSAGEEHPRIIRIDKLWTNATYVTCLLMEHAVLLPISHNVNCRRNS